VTVTREPEWDDAQRDAMLGLAIYEGGVCSGCGFHRSIADDKDNLIAIEEHVCSVCRSGTQYGRIQGSRDTEHENRLGESPPPAAPRPSDGRSTYFRLLSPAEAELRRRRSGE
jgi:hypothetical protein